MTVKTNPDKELVRHIREQLKAEDGYCPCRLNHTPDTKCMCREFREQIDRGEEGSCHCGLYICYKERVCRSLTWD